MKLVKINPGKNHHREHPIIRRAGKMLALASAMVLLSATIALADNVLNDVVAGGNDTITAGGSTTVGYRIVANNGDGQTGCNASDGSPGVMKINTPAGVTASLNPISFTACGVLQSTNFTASTPGNYQITVSVDDSGTGTYNTTPATFTLKVLAPTDTTPPAANPSQSPAANGNGWNNSDVTVSWNWSDAGGIDAANCTTSSTSSGEGTITLNAACKDIAGNTGNASYEVKVDKTAPLVTATASPGPNGNGWNNTDVTVAFDGADGGSGIAGCDAAATLSDEGAGQSASGSCTDNAGNSASATASNINIDMTAPSVSLVGGPTEGASYPWGSVPAIPTCSASDDLSGLAGNCAISGYGTSIGSHTVRANVSDKAGNMAVEASAAYSVEAWKLHGFFNPVDMGYLNTVKGGSTVPLKFRIFAGSTELTDVSAITGLSAVTMACPGVSMPVAPVEELAAAGGTVLRYDATGGQFIYNWKTLKNPGKCYKVTLTTQDGSKITADFKLT